MSKLSKLIQITLEKYIFRGRALELFPGSHPDSINLLYRLTGSKVIAIGDELDNDPYQYSPIYGLHKLWMPDEK